MSSPRAIDDPLWPRASAWLAADPTQPDTDLAILGVPTHQTSISPTRADTTPAAIRAALARYSTYAASHDVDVATLSVRDHGDVTDPDGADGVARTQDAAHHAATTSRLLIALGGDNSLTYSVMTGVCADALPTAGLITLDAHHDLRDGVSNGSPVRQLIEAGLPGRQVVQIGIADFANSAEYAHRAKDLGITVITREALRHEAIDSVMVKALEIAGAGHGPIHVDLDVDVCDRAVVPGCPASAPGGISADELRHIAFLAGRSPRVRSIDIAEIDADADTPDQRTVRLGALLVLEAAAGLARR